MSDKKFDAVKMMRDIREELSAKYWKHSEILKKEMEEIRKKYDMHDLPNSSIAAEPHEKYGKK
jgi:hypothetical protein